MTEKHISHQQLHPSLDLTARHTHPRRPPRPSTHRPHPHRWRRVLIGVSTMVAILILVGSWVMYRTIASVNTQDPSGKRIGFFQQVARIVTARGDRLEGEDDDRVNFLLMGIGGPGHDGPYLTDTLMLASYQPSTKRVAMISIPRDLVVNIPGYDYRKINNVLSIGREQKYPGGGEAFVVKTVSDLFSVPIHYYARVDFQGFIDIIDRLGGIQITVDTPFVDSQYPTENYGYQAIRFNSGQQEMNGETALKFTRSRHGTNGEGSDFARAKRQQKVLVAIRERILSVGTILNPLKISDILQALGDHSQTNMEVWEMLRLGSLAKEVETDRIINRVLDDRTNGMLRSTTGAGGAYVLIPRTGRYDEIAFLANHIFEMDVVQSIDLPIMIVNASKRTGLADRTAQGLLGLGFSSVRTANRTAPTPETVILDASLGQATPTLGLIAEYIHTTKISTPIAWADETGDRTILDYFKPSSTNTNNPTPKILILYGTDQPVPPKTIFSTTPRTTNTAGSSSNKNTNSSTNRNVNSNRNTNARTTNSSVSP